MTECPRGGVHGWELDADDGAHCWKCGAELTPEEVSVRLGEVLS